MNGLHSKYRRKSSITVMDKQSTCFSCKIYQEEHYGTLRLTYDGCTKQLASLAPIQLNNYIIGQNCETFSVNANKAIQCTIFFPQIFCSYQLHNIQLIIIISKYSMFHIQHSSELESPQKLIRKSGKSYPSTEWLPQLQLKSKSHLVHYLESI